LSGPVPVSASVRAHAAAVPGGSVWLAQLPALVTDLEQLWQVEVTEWIPGATTAVVARATTRDGRPAVIKVAVPGGWFDEQVQSLASARGDGYVRLLAYDRGRHAALLEALGLSLVHSGLAPSEQIAILGRLVRRAWRPQPGPRQARDKAAELGELVPRLWEELGRPCSEQVVEHAVACARRRSAAFDPSHAVVVHGDAAAANAARVLAPRDGTEDGFVLLDPDQFVGDRTYDLGVAVRDWCPELLAAADPVGLFDGWCRLLAAATATDPQAVVDWGYLERVSTGLWAMSLTAEHDALGHLRSAQALVDGWASADA
jgi:streptomycin 6-kinase